MAERSQSEVIVEVVCKPLSLRNKENLIIWVLAQSASQVEVVLEPLASKIVAVTELPKGLVLAARADIDCFLPDESGVLLDIVAKRTGSVKAYQHEAEVFNEKMVG